MTRADKSWNIFPTAQRFPFFTNSMDSQINMKTICSTVNHRTVSHDAQNLLSTVYIPQSPKFKRVSLNETPEFPFRGRNI